MKHAWTLRTGRKKRQTPCTSGGFTLMEVVFASSISLLLFLVLFESLSVCQRLAADLKWRLAADSIAFDTAWEMFNQQLSWFDKLDTEKYEGDWEAIPAERSSVWITNRVSSCAYRWLSITPNLDADDVASNWVIRTNVEWPALNNRMEKLPKDYEITRTRNERNRFRATN